MSGPVCSNFPSVARVCMILSVLMILSVKCMALFFAGRRYVQVSQY